MTRATTRTLALALAVVALGGCFGNGQLLHELGPEEVWTRAMDAYEDENWAEAVRSFDQLLVRYPNHEHWQEARWYLADSHYRNEDYVTAANEFDRFAREFSGTDRADDARFKVCQSYHRLSPDVQLDQMYTQAALDHCRSLVGYFPSSEHVDRAQAIMDEMQAKLARKTYIGGEFYFSRKLYDSALLYYEEVLASHPSSEVVPEALLRMVQIYVELGYEDDAQTARTRLLEEFPDTAAAEQAKAITVADNS